MCESEHIAELSEKIIDSWKTTDNSAEKQQQLANFKADIELNIPTEFALPLSDMDKLKGANSTHKAWLIATNVYHNACAYQATPAEHKDTPALMVLASYLRNGYLHSAIREKGGAYGGGASYDSNSSAFRFYSYRDPHCAETFEHFSKSIDWLLNEEQSAEQLEEAILGVVSGMDKPSSPAGEAIKSCFAKLHEREQAWQQAMRHRLLTVTLKDLQNVAKKYLQKQPCTKATIAPYNKADELEKMGFEVETLGVE